MVNPTTLVALGTGSLLAVNAVAIAAAMVLLWLASLHLANASIVDIFWGIGFVLVATVSLGGGEGDPERQILLTLLTVAWGLRLAGYLARRNGLRLEDPRYRAMRRRRGRRFPVVSLATVFLLQGALIWVVALPVQLGQADPNPARFGVVTWLGTALWGIGFVFESVGDAQLARFKADPSNAGQVMQQGLWRYTRHPNYFGDFCVWWGLYVVAADTALGRASVAGPIIMTVLLTRGSGVPLLERSITERRPGYEEYVERTSAFFPRPPSRRRLPSVG